MAAAPQYSCQAADEPVAWSVILAIESHKGLFTVAELAPELKKSPSTVYRLVRLRQLPYFRIGGTIYFDPAALGMYLRRKSPESAAAARALTRPA